MELVRVRKIVVNVETIWHEGGPLAARPLLVGWAGAAVANPYAGRYVEEVQPMMEALKPLGVEMSRRLLQAMGGDPKAIEAYGKASLIGAAGEQEHGALWHVPGGYAMRDVLGSAKAIVPSAVKVGPVGARIDIPIHHKDAAYVRSHFSGIEAGIPDAPRADELVFFIAMTTGGRVHERMGGLKASEIKVWDGQR
jgi:hypothetical protein